MMRDESERPIELAEALWPDPRMNSFPSQIMKKMNRLTQD
jgi:hypothetical protein